MCKKKKEREREKVAVAVAAVTVADSNLVAWLLAAFGLLWLGLGLASWLAGNRYH